MLANSKKNVYFNSFGVVNQEEILKLDLSTHISALFRLMVCQN